MRFSIIAFIVLPVSLFAATEVTRYGVTWQFQDDETVGTYVNGDPWVLAPISITNINPHTVVSNVTLGGTNYTATRNGSMIDPRCNNLASSPNGLDSFYTGSGYAFSLSPYAESLNVGFVTNSAPLTIATNCTLWSSISKPFTGVDADVRPSLYCIACLTVVTQAPASGSFRPQPYSGSKVQTNNYANLNWSLLKSLAVVSNTPTFAATEAYLPQGVVPDFLQGQGVDQYTRPVTNCPENYPAYTSEYIGDALCLINLNYTQSQKSNLVVWITQYGIDVYGAISDGAFFTDNGGLSAGRKGPMVFAASMLNNTAMLTACNGTNNFVFHEDRQTWYVSQYDVGRLVKHDDYPDKYREEYIQADVGIAEWGVQHATMEFQDGRNLNAAYRDINQRAFDRVLLGLSIMGVRTNWGWNALTDYHRRMWYLYKTNGLPAVDWSDPPGALNWFPAFSASMYYNYFDSYMATEASDSISTRYLFLRR